MGKLRKYRRHLNKNKVFVAQNTKKLTNKLIDNLIEKEKNNEIKK